MSGVKRIQKTPNTNKPQQNEVGERDLCSKTTKTSKV